jgi:negative regulator of genetic competence, sporulation and motility
MAYSSADLEMVDRHIAQGERHVTQQEELVARLRSHGLPTDEAENLLEEFRALLLQHREHRRVMLGDLGLNGA